MKGERPGLRLAQGTWRVSAQGFHTAVRAAEPRQCGPTGRGA